MGMVRVGADAQQMADTLMPVDIKGRHHASADDRVNEFIPGQKVTELDSQLLRQYNMRSMAGLLDQQTATFVKSYGFNSLATLGFRGASAAQSAVYWNGVPLAQASMGIADISTIPVFFMHNASLVMGSNSALWGSGNVGGALLLESGQPRFDSAGHELNIAAGAGSFGQRMAGVTASVWGKKWYFSADFFTQHADNDFNYTGLSGAQTRMTHSSLGSNALQMHLARKLGQRQHVGLHAWMQRYDRDIPPAMFESASAKTQRDDALHLLADWRLHIRNGKIYARASFSNDRLDYKDDIAGIAEKPVSQQYYAEVGWERTFGTTSRLLVFAPVQSQLMWQTNVAAMHSQNRVALAVAYKQELFGRRLQLALNAREEFYMSTQVFCPGADAGFKLADWIVLRGNVQRTYRIPSLNELYYWPGGNIMLKPEQGWNENLGYHMSHTFGPIVLSHDLDWFNRNIRDWIIWLGGAVWTPYNIASVHSRGIETDNKAELRIRSWNFQLGVNTSYVLATTETSYIPNDGSLGQQLPYTPRYNYRFSFTVSHMKTEVGYNHAYTGYRFITTDGSEYLSPYQTGNLRVSWKSTFLSRPLQVYFQYNNIWNASYQVVAFRPMPDANWLAGLSLRAL